MNYWWDTHAYQQQQDLTAQRDGLTRSVSVMIAFTSITASPGLTATDQGCG
jgi:hypothetical protein